METTTTTEQTFTCPAGLRLNDGKATLWVRSPRTGVTVTVAADRFSELPARLVARLTKFIGEGRHGFAFTRRELLAVAEAAKPAAAPAVAQAADLIAPAPRRSFWGTPAMSKAEPIPAALPALTVEAAGPAVHCVPVARVGYGIEGRLRFIRIELPTGPVELSWQDWFRLSPALLGRINAGESVVEMTDVQIAAVVEAAAAAARSVASNAGRARRK